MSQNSLQTKVQALLLKADIQTNGDRPWDIQVHNKNFYARLLADRSLGLGESYVEGWWDCNQLDDFVNKALRAKLDKTFNSFKDSLAFIRAKLFNLQKPSRAYQVGKRHYDIDNNLFKIMLGQKMVYSCAYWKTAKNLDEAQEAKLELSCQKLMLKPGMKVLDIGCGWGETAKYAAEKYGVEVVGITVSKEQVELGKKLCKNLPVDIRLQDYRTLTRQYDRIISLGMFEHVGVKNYRKFMQVIKRCLKPEGLFLLQTVGNNESAANIDPWMGRYIFPNSMTPSAKQIGKAIEDLLILEDWHNFGPDYDKTLVSWYQNFQEHWKELKKEHDEHFYRMWKYYLLSCAGAFRARWSQLWQIVFSTKGHSGTYLASR